MSGVRLDKAAGERFVSVPSDLVARIDAFAERTHTSRAKATRFLLQAALAGVAGKGFSPTRAARAIEKIATGASSSPSESPPLNGGGQKHDRIERLEGVFRDLVAIVRDHATVIGVEDADLVVNVGRHEDAWGRVQEFVEAKR